MLTLNPSVGRNVRRSPVEKGARLPGRLLPESLADEIRREPGPWYVYGARFTRSFPSDSTNHFGAWVTISGGTYSAEVELTARSSAEARRVSEALRRAGYVVGAIRRPGWLFGRRPLRGLRELGSEVRHLEALVEDPGAVERLPKRAARLFFIDAPEAPRPVLGYLAQLPHWVWSWAGVERQGVPAFLRDAGWGALAWCSLLVAPGDEPILNLGVQLFRPAGDVTTHSAEFRRARAAIAAVLQPEGYRLLEQRRGRSSSRALLLLEKRVKTLAVARRARARLDELLFEPTGAAPRTSQALRRPRRA